ncbi:MAG: hypothetical protein ACOYMA_20725 [Bacteroidia bacterium]
MISNSNILLLEKLLHLSKRLERTRIFELLEPWNFKGNDIIEVQKAAKKISDFIGLPNLTFIINYTQQEKNTAGHIELNNNSAEGVFIEIDEKYKSESQIILAILAHEICHKLIHINGLTLYGYENEILTDTATVFSGLGKLSLNGCEVKNISSNTEWNGSEKTTTTTTTTNKVGYLNREQFAFLYNVVCNMRKIPYEYATKNLSDDVLNALLKNEYNHDEEIFQNDFIRSKSIDVLEKFNHQYHLVSAENLKLTKTLQFNIESLITSDRIIHNKIKSTNEKFITKATENLNPERINYIKNLLLLNELDNLHSLYESEAKELILVNNTIKELFANLNEIFLINIVNREILYNIKCPVCGNLMRLRQDKLAKIKCTKCKYPFLVDNTSVENIIECESPKTRKSLSKKLKQIIAILKE